MKCFFFLLVFMSLCAEIQVIAQTSVSQQYWVYWRNRCDRELGPVLNKENTNESPKCVTKEEVCFSIPRCANLPTFRPVHLHFLGLKLSFLHFPWAVPTYPWCWGPASMPERRLPWVSWAGRVFLVFGSFCFSLQHHVSLSQIMRMASNCAFAVLPARVAAVSCGWPCAPCQVWCCASRKWSVQTRECWMHQAGPSDSKSDVFTVVNWLVDGCLWARWTSGAGAERGWILMSEGSRCF